MVIIGASFSLHRAQELGLDKKALLNDAISQLGFRRFRLMSYWNIHEQQQGNYNFDDLDWQLDMIADAGGTATLCVGKRQPRWPECHIPDWAVKLPQHEWYEALFLYIETVVKRYKDHPALESWQLENESLLKNFGYCPDGDYNRQRLIHELDIVKKLDQTHPVIMTLSDSWGIPWRSPNPDIYAMSLYRSAINKKGKFFVSKRPAIFYTYRAAFIEAMTRKPVFIHELQAEPWLSKTLLEVPLETQLSRMSPELITSNIAYAKSTNMKVMDLWGLEWWYWLKTVHNRPEQWDAVTAAVAEHELQRQRMQ